MSTHHIKILFWNHCETLLKWIVQQYSKMLTQLKIELIDEREIEFTYVQGLMYVQPRRAWVEMSQDKIDSSFERQAFYIVHTSCIQDIMHEKVGH